jgi:hypothetical protein
MMMMMMIKDAQWASNTSEFYPRMTRRQDRYTFHSLRRVYPKVSGLAA